MVVVVLIVAVSAGVYWFYRSSNAREIPLSIDEIDSFLTLHIIDERDNEAYEVEDAPPEPIHYPPINITMVSFGTHDGYLYIKFDLEGKIPVRKDDPVTSISIGASLDADGNDSTGWYGIDVILDFYLDWDFLGNPHVGTYIIKDLATTTDEKEAQESAQTLIGEYKGGPGKNFVVIRVPMDLIGIKSGQNVVMGVSAEAESPKYHHYAYDGLCSSQYEYTGSGNYVGYHVVIPIP